MSTTIDSLQIEIQSNSSNAAVNIRDLSKALGELKKNSSVNVAIHGKLPQRHRSQCGQGSGWDGR